jgi:nicotinate-nucleotide pyrophosphorylase (carboxylating)
VELSLSSQARGELLRTFLAEDIGQGDTTSKAIVPPDCHAESEFEAKSPLILAGMELALETLRILDPDLVTHAVLHDGQSVRRGEILARVTGNVRALLAGERVALNLLQRLSGIATLTRRFVDAIAGTRAEILDTRKTTPGLRAFEKYAVTVGGGQNHRFALDDAILIKDNHVRIAGGVGAAIRAAKCARGDARWIEAEVTNFAELDEAIVERPDVILLDNFSPADVRKAVPRVRQNDSRGAIRLEASGGITLETVRAFAETGVDWISVGALTHSAPAADISLEIRVK